jgi:hypothetical protein
MIVAPEVGTRPAVPHFDLSSTPTPTVSRTNFEPIHGRYIRRQPALICSASPQSQVYQSPLSLHLVPQYPSPAPLAATKMRPDTPSPMPTQGRQLQYNPLDTPSSSDPVRIVAEVKFPHLKGKELDHAVSEYLRNQYLEDDEWVKGQVRQLQEAVTLSTKLELEQRQFVAMYGDVFPDIDLRKLIQKKFLNLCGDALLVAVEDFMKDYEQYRRWCEQEELERPKYRSIRATPAHLRMAYRSSTPCPEFVFPLPGGEEPMGTLDHSRNSGSEDYPKSSTSNTYLAHTSEAYPMQTLNINVDDDEETISNLRDIGPHSALSCNSLFSRNRYNLSIAVPPATHPAYGTKLDVSPKIAVRGTVEEPSEWAQDDARAERLRHQLGALSVLSGGEMETDGTWNAVRAREVSPVPPPRHIQGLSEATKRRLAKERKIRIKMDERKRRAREKETKKGCTCVVM